MKTMDDPDAFVKQQAVARRLASIRRRIMVMSGKGGVGKSTVAVNLAASLALQGRRVGLLDVDIHGPSIPSMLGLSGMRLQTRDGLILPVEKDGMKVMSIGFMLPDADTALIWRGPMKYNVIRQFIQDVDWGELDDLIIDAPPGTGDEPLAVCQLAEPLDGALLVTTPQQVATTDVRKSVTFCRQLHLPVLGMVENMSGFACPKCGQVTAIFKDGGGETLAREQGIPFLGKIPIDPAIGAAGDEGRPFLNPHDRKGPTALAFETLVALLFKTTPVDPVADQTVANTTDSKPNMRNQEDDMRIAIPMADGKLCLHFGHCEQFALLDVLADTHTIEERAPVTPPPHEPGVLPRWLHEQGVNVVIAGGMGQRAQAAFAEQGIAVVAGAGPDDPVRLVRQYLDGTLQTGPNACDH